MKKTIITVFVVALTAALTAALSACGGMGEMDKEDDPLNGYWLGAAVQGTDKEYITFNGGSLECRFYMPLDETSGLLLPPAKGTYGVDGNKMTITLTHFQGTPPGSSQAQWYSESDLSETAYAAMLGKPYLYDYAIIGSTKLALTDDEGIIRFYSRQ